MARIVFIGGFTPMQKVLYAIKQTAALEYLALYTEIGDNLTIEKCAKERGLKLNDVKILKSAKGRRQLKDLKPDWIFNVNSTIVLPSEILTIPRVGCLNLHPGKLPEYAGLHVHQWAIRNDEQTFASTVHWMEEGIDTGPIAYSKEFPIEPEDSGLSLFMKCIKAGTNLILQALEDVASGKQTPQTPQDLTKRRLYTQKAAMDGHISWQWTARQIYNFIRAADYHPFHSPTYIPISTLNDQKEIEILKAKEADKSGDRAGEILSVDQNGVCVAAGDQKSVLITKIRHNGSVLQGEKISENLGCRPGDLFT